MNAIGRRLRRLEDQLKPRVNEHGETAADVVRSRRRRRLEAAGLPYEDRPREISAALGQGAKPFVGQVRGPESETLVRRWQDEGSQAVDCAG